ncbi:MAG: hypothetical protein AAF937_09850 [Planctomycetota bacterium]
MQLLSDNFGWVALGAVLVFVFFAGVRRSSDSLTTVAQTPLRSAAGTRSVAVAGAIFVIYISISGVVGMTPMYLDEVMRTLQPRPQQIDRLADEVLFRNLWIVSATSFIVVAGALASAARSLVAQRDSKSIFPTAHFWLLTASFGIGAVVLVATLSPPFGFVEFFQHARGELFAPIPRLDAHWLPRGAYVLAAVPIAHFALACGALRDIASQEDSKSTRVSQLKRLDTLLKLGSILLVLGTLMTYAIWSWGVSTFDWPSDAARQAAESLPQVTTTMGALLWSVLLGALYIPTHHVVACVKTKDDAQAAPIDPQGGNAKKEGNDLPSTTAWPNILAIVAPILVSIGAPLTESLVGTIAGGG